MRGYEPRVLVFLCQWCSYRGADAAGRQRLVVPGQVRPVRVPCAGRVAPEQVLETLHGGADGVLVLACHPGNCHYRHGNLRAGQRVRLLQTLLAQAGVARGRVCFDHVAAGEGGRYVAVTAAFIQRLRELGPGEAERV